MKWLFTSLALLGMTAQASVICTGCGYEEGAPATYLGQFNADNRDTATFHHTGVPSDEFTDVWIFDVAQNFTGSVSADFTALAAIRDFNAVLLAAEGGECVGNTCAGIDFGEVLREANLSDSKWEVLFNSLPSGRYALRVTGIGNDRNGGAYTGQIGIAPVAITQPNSLILFVLGGVALLLVAFGAYLWRKRNQERADLL